MNRILFVAVVILGGVSPGRAELPPMAACRAAYQAFDSWKVFDACGQLVADGEEPEDANVWDWLMLAQIHVNDAESNWGTIRNLRNKSLNSVQRTGSWVFSKFEGADNEKTRKEYFAEIRSFGPWFNVYANSKHSDDWKPYYKLHEKHAKTNSPAFDPAEMRKNILALVDAKKWEEALRASAALVAYEPTLENYGLRGDVQSAAGNYLLAGYNYQTASQLRKDLNEFLKFNDKFEAARSSFTAHRGSAKPGTFLEMLLPMASYVREKSNRAPKYSSIGLRTQWQADGALRLWSKHADGIYLLPDGVNYQKALTGGKRGPVESPKETPSGKRIYPLSPYEGIAWFPPDSLPWTPFGSFYFGSLTAFSGEGEGYYVMADEYNQLEGPFLYGQPWRVVKEVSRAAEGDKTIVTFTDGLVVTTQPGRQARIDIPGGGWFRGDITKQFFPYTGVLTGDDGQWSLFYEGVVRGITHKGQEKYHSVDLHSGITLQANGDVVYHKQIGDDHTWIAYPATGEERLTTTKTIEPDWAAFEAARQAQAEKEELDDALREARSYVPESSVRICTRCNGTGRLWQGGGASQERVSAPSGSNSSQQEDFYNSASSVRTNYSSGSMGVCPVCNGTGRP